LFELIIWYLLISILGILTFPLAYKMLPALADRGYAFSRALSLLIWSFVFWFLGSFGILRNDIGGQMFALLILLLVSGWALRRTGWDEIRSWLRSQRRLVITVEVLFLLAFLTMAAFRGANPEIAGTEKPMELAFINAILRSPTLPPHDPWLSGYAISYYYFGYVMVAMLARLAGTGGNVAFNLGISLVFALSASGAYGLLYNLLALRKNKEPRRPLSAPHAPLPALLGPFFLLIVSNFGGLLHLLHIGKVFWSRNQAGEWISPFWTWLDMGSYAEPPPAETFPHWWWWQASRIVQDFNFSGASKGDIIDEFPFFSFLLGDLHPHVLAMPFALLAIALALNLFLGGARGKINLLGLRLDLSPQAFVFASVILGSLGFLNTWDFPFYVALFVGAYFLMKRNSPDEPPRSLGVYVGDFFGLGLALGIAGILLYLPFYLSFSSQAGGPIPNLIYITKGFYTWIHFGILLVPLFAFTIYLWKTKGNRDQLKSGLMVTLGLVASLMVITLVFAGLIAGIHILQNLNPDAGIAADAYLGSLGAPDWQEAISEGFLRRLIHPGTWLTLLALLTLTFAMLWPQRSDHPTTQLFDMAQDRSSSLPSSATFVLLLTLVGALLVLGPEFFFLRDFFGSRINTIFKFYFQAWLMWAITAAYAMVVLWQELRRVWRWVFIVGMLSLLCISLTYPAMGVWSKTNHFNPPTGWTLDGSAYLVQYASDEAAAMDWLRHAPLGVVAEAVGGSYSSYARMSANSGQPTVLGWDGHEHQWRGGFEEMGSRASDIQRLYCTSIWVEALGILQQYDIRYVVVGNLERAAYAAGSKGCPRGLDEGKFMFSFDVVFQQGGITIYQVPTGSE
jgi:YYY domain-containing protein